MEDFVIYEWLINGVTCYDICEFKRDAEVGSLVNFDEEKPKLICEISEDNIIVCSEGSKHNKIRRTSFHKFSSTECKWFEKVRIDMKGIKFCR